MFKKFVRNILHSISFNLFSWLMLSCVFIKWKFVILSGKGKISFFDYIMQDKGNTIYEIECHDCGHKVQYMSGVGHTANIEDVFVTNLAYCPICMKPLTKTRFMFGKGNRNENEYCSSCGTKVQDYKETQDVKLHCPNCSSTNTSITNLHQIWMT